MHYVGEWNNLSYTVLSSDLTIVLLITVALMLSPGKGFDFTKFKTRHNVERFIRKLSLLIADILLMKY